MMLQMNEKKKEKLADFIIENNKTPEILFKKLDNFHNKLFK